MREKSTARVLLRLQQAQSRRQLILDDLIRTDPLIIGSLSEVLRRCGKPSCHCAQQPGHPQAILMTTHDGRRRCQVVRQADLADVQQAVARYRDFRAELRQLSTLDSTVLTLLKELMNLRDKGYD